MSKRVLSGLIALTMTASFFCSCKKTDEIKTDTSNDSSSVLVNDSSSVLVNDSSCESVAESQSDSKNDSSSKAETKTNNVKFYQDRMIVGGDSIAYGFCAYKYIPYEHNIASGSTALRNYDDKSNFTFDPTGTSLGFVEAIEAVKPSLMYISMGMNDVNIIDSNQYIERYKGLIAQIKKKVSDCVIVTASITPITQASKFTNIDNIRTFNADLKKMVDEMNDENVVFFDAYNAIVGSDGKYIPNDYSPNDGIHLAPECYKMMIEKLTETLDKLGMKEKIEKIEKNRK